MPLASAFIWTAPAYPLSAIAVSWHALTESTSLSRTEQWIGIVLSPMAIVAFFLAVFETGASLKVAWIPLVWVVIAILTSIYATLITKRGFQ